MAFMSPFPCIRRQLHGHPSYSFSAAPVFPLVTTSRRRRSTPVIPSAVFLPPGGIPMMPEEGNGEEDTQRRGGGEESSSAGRPPVGKGRLEGVEVLLEGEYDTWERRNRRKTLSGRRGRREVAWGAKELNERLEAKGVERHRLVLAPDEAFGALFTWNAVISNARELELQAWKVVALEENLLPPDLDDMVRAEGMAPEAAVQRVFYWDRDWGRIKKLCFRKFEVMKELEKDFEFKLHDGFQAWIRSLETYGVSCVICAPLPKAKMEKILVGLGVKSPVKKLVLVSNEDEFETLEQMFLLAALKAGRPPGKCAVFTDTPPEITAGHEISAKVVALIGAHKAYEVKTADAKVRGYDELVLYNVRRLFSEDGEDIVEPLTQVERR